MQIRGLSPRVFALLLAVLVVPACAGNGGGGGSSSSGGPGTVEDMPTDTRAFMEEGLRQFSRGDPAWPETRTRWLRMGKRESDLLVSMMFAGLLRAQKLAAPELVEQARHELVLIGAPSVDFLASVLAAGTAYTVYDEQEEQTKTVAVDDTSRREAAEILALIGAPAAPALAGVLDRAESKSGRRFALTALGDMGERGGRTASDALVRWAASSDWVLRVGAVHGLRSFGDPQTAQVLVRALSDSESLVREKAADALVVRRERSAIPALRRAASEAQSAGRLLEARRFQSTIARIEGGR